MFFLVAPTFWLFEILDLKSVLFECMNPLLHANQHIRSSKATFIEPGGLVTPSGVRDLDHSLVLHLFPVRHLMHLRYIYVQHIKSNKVTLPQMYHLLVVIQSATMVILLFKLAFGISNQPKLIRWVSVVIDFQIQSLCQYSQGHLWSL